MFRYIIVSIGSGLLFGVLDGFIHANPLAQKLYQVYAPIAKSSIDPIAGTGIDLAYGFIMAGIFLRLYRSLPGRSGFMKGLSFGLLVWFFRVVMAAASTWMMFEVPANLIIYNLLAGLGEMLVLGIIFGLAI
jgi:hypothetical protein